MSTQSATSPMGVRWSVLRSIGNTPVVKIAGLFPIVGYLILFNEKLEPYLELVPMHLESGEQMHFAFADKLIDMKMYFIYHGMLYLGLGSLFYQVFCPRIIKRYQDHTDYIDRELQFIMRGSLDSMIARMDAKPGYVDPGEDYSTGYKMSVMQKYYNHLNFLNKRARDTVGVLFASGLFLLSIPAFAVFVRIMASMAYRLLGSH